MRNCFILSLIIALILPGCATILAGGADQVPVESLPAGARVYLDDNLVGVTPTTVTMSRKSSGKIKVELPDGRVMERDLDKVANGWVFGNIVLGGLIGLVVDLAANNQGKYSTDTIFFNLEGIPRATAAAKPRHKSKAPESELE